MAEMAPLFSTLAFLLSLGAIAPYVWNVATGKVTTTLSTWVAWALMNAALLAGIISAGGMSWQVLAFVVGNLSVVAAGIYSGAQLKLTKLDIGCLGIVILAIIMWAVSGNPVVGVVMSTVGLAAGVVPLLKHVWENPEQEFMYPWAIFALGSIFALLGVTTPSISTLLPPIFFLSMQLLLIFLISRKLWAKK
jgi:hypothetical protein